MKHRKQLGKHTKAGSITKPDSCGELTFNRKQEHAKTTYLKILWLLLNLASFHLEVDCDPLFQAVSVQLFSVHKSWIGSPNKMNGQTSSGSRFCLNRTIHRSRCKFLSVISMLMSVCEIVTGGPVSSCSSKQLFGVWCVGTINLGIN